MLTEIVTRSQSGGGPGMGPPMGGGPGAGIPAGMGPPGMQGDGMVAPGEKSIVLSIPPDKCGLIIGKGGETIKMVGFNKSTVTQIFVLISTNSF